MFTPILFLVLMTAVPLLVWRKFPTSSVLFVSAAAIWTLYSVATVLTHGLSKTFTWEGIQATLIFWPVHVRMIAYYTVPALILFGMERWRVAPNRWLTFCFFWICSSFLTIGQTASHLYSGYQYPPIGLETLSPEQLGYVNLAIYLSNATYLLAPWIFFGLVAWPLILRTPSALKRLVVRIRSF